MYYRRLYINNSDGNATTKRRRKNVDDLKIQQVTATRDGIKESVPNIVQYTRNSSWTIRSRMRIDVPKVMNYIG